ncbi:calcium-binding protein [Erythrobacter sp. HA6-11]
MNVITGTDDPEVINGTENDDDIQALGGNDEVFGGEGDDTIDGGDGDDRLFGEAGDDTIDGGEGNDQIFGGGGTNILRGGNGNDYIVSRGENDLVEGGAGNDEVLVEFSSLDPEPDAPPGVNPTVTTGAGQDRVRYGAEGAGGSIDLGADDDRLDLLLFGTGVSVTLGTGSDVVALSSLPLVDPGIATFTDFEAGDNGDVIDFSQLQEVELFDYDGFANPFGTGHFVLEANGEGSVIHIAPFADAFFAYSLFFPNVAPEEFTAYNFGGILPSGENQFGPPLEGTPDPDTLDGTDLAETISGFDGNDTINALGGDDTIIGGAGADTLNGGDGDDLFIFDFSSEPGLDPSENPALDTLIDGGAGTDTVRVIGSNQGVELVEYNIGTDLPFVSIERIEFSGNTYLEGTAAEFAAFEFIAASRMRITDNTPFTPTGGFEVTELSFGDGGNTVDLSGPDIYVLNVVSGDGDDNIIGPDQGIANPSSNQTDIEVGIDVRGGNDTVVVGDIRTRVVSSGGNNHFTGGAQDDGFNLFGDGDNFVNGGGGNDGIAINGVGTATVFGGAGDDTISIEFFDATDQISGGDGIDTLNLNAPGGELLDLTGFTLPADIENLNVNGAVLLTIAQIQSLQGLTATELRIADGGALALSVAPGFTYLSPDGNTVDFRGVTNTSVSVFGNIGDDVIFGGAEFNNLVGGSGNDRLVGQDDDDSLQGQFGFDILEGFGGADSMFGGALDDRLIGGLGDDFMNGGTHIDTAVFSGNRADYTITQTQLGIFQVVGPDGTDWLEEIEYAEFDDETVRLYRGEGIAVNFDTVDPSVYQDAMFNIRDFDGNGLGGDGFWLRIGAADINGDGDIDQILVNFAIGRFATVATAEDGLVYFEDYSWGGETRVAGTYIDPLVASGDVVAGGPFDSQTRFQNDLAIQNINRVLGADDYDGDGIQEVFFALTDGTAYLRALMHADGNIRYANYQSEQQVIDYLTANGYDESTFGDWFTTPVAAASQTASASDEPNDPVSQPLAVDKNDNDGSGSTGTGSLVGETMIGDMSSAIALSDARIAGMSLVEQQMYAEFFG